MVRCTNPSTMNNDVLWSFWHTTQNTVSVYRTDRHWKLKRRLTKVLEEYINIMRQSIYTTADIAREDNQNAADWVGESYVTSLFLLGSKFVVLKDWSLQLSFSTLGFLSYSVTHGRGLYFEELPQQHSKMAGKLKWYRSFGQKSSQILTVMIHFQPQQRRHYWDPHGPCACYSVLIRFGKHATKGDNQQIIIRCTWNYGTLVWLTWP